MSHRSHLLSGLPLGGCGGVRGHLRWGRGVGRVTEGRGAPILQGEGGADPRWAPRRQAILCAATGTLRRGRERSARRGWVGAEGVCRSDTLCHPRGEGAKGKQMCGPCPQLWKGTENASCPASSQWDGGSQPPCWCRGSPKLGPPGSTLITVSYTHLTLPTTGSLCRSRWSPYH